LFAQNYVYAKLVVIEFVFYSFLLKLVSCWCLLDMVDFALVNFLIFFCINMFI